MIYLVLGLSANSVESLLEVYHNKRMYISDYIFRSYHSENIKSDTGPEMP